MANLNLGSGNNHIDGFISVDKYDEEAHVKVDIKNLPYEDNSIDEIVAYQVIEHIPYNESEDVLQEMYRVLKPGGTAIIETPDIDYVCRAILSDGLTDNWIFNLVGEYYRPWDKGRYKDWKMNAGSIHRNPWNEDRLTRMAEHVGFKVERLYGDDMLYKYEENLAVKLTK